MDGPSFRTGIDLDDLLGLISDRDSDSNKRRLRCPKCRWEPRKSDRWQCVCNHHWHALDAHGLCPQCQSQWRHAQCLRCAEWSSIEAWLRGQDRR
ncbi:hypothetical protein AKJ09_00407 [Labilithrix luteola]|uniref:Uncharacterized protein n=1 Tax=Labilithrix luteola TaxID=1391654 RepID=A0A0K1PJM8_9BACT|nr:hypothetical protein AKJ09_00407 [Labilithrix luteola]